MRLKKLLVLSVLLLGVGTTAVAQTATPKPLRASELKVVTNEMVATAPEKVMHNMRSPMDKVQEPKWLTTVPMVGDLYKMTMYGFSDDCVAHYSAVMPTDVVAQFVGNKITSLRMVLPATGFDPAFWVLDAQDSSADPLFYQAYSGEYEADALLEIPCDIDITDARELQVGYSLNFKGNKDAHIKLTVAPNYRDYGFLIQTTSSDFKAGMTYNYSTYPQYTGKDYYYGLAIYCVTEGDAGFKQNGLKVVGVGHSKVEMGKDTKINMTLTNYGCQPVNNADFTFQYGDEVKAGKADAPIPFLGSASFPMSISTEGKAARTPVRVEVTKMNGEDLAEPIVAEGSVTAIDPDKSVERTVVMEEYTGAWCGWCPRGAVGMEKLVEEYPDQFIPIAVHYGDVMQENAFFDLISTYSGGFPGSILNRVKQVDPYYGTDTGTPFGIDNQMLPMIYSLTEASVNIEGAEIDKETGKVKITASATFTVDCDLENAPYCFSYVITEDGVNGKDLPASQRKDYLQSNYFSTNSQYTSDPYLKHLTSMGSYIEVDFDHVARHAESILGIAGSLSGKFNAGDKLSHTYEFALPTNIKDLSKCNLIALLVDKGTGEIVNAKQVAMKSVTAVESATAPLASAEVKVVAGGVQVSADDATVNVYTAAGALVAQQAVQGKTFVALNAGNYVVRVVKGNDVFVKKVSL
jgi:thiol-disulfide isomerase/thioredoxin